MANIKRTIAIVCGGDSSEHDVSMRSAQGLYSFFDKDKYDLYIVDIKGQDWHVDFPDGTIAPIDRNDFSFRHNGKTVVVDINYQIQIGSSYRFIDDSLCFSGAEPCYLRIKDIRISLVS